MLPLLFAEAAAAPAPEVVKPVLPMLVLGGIMTLTCVSFALGMGVFKDEAGHSAYDRAVHDNIGHDIGVP